MKLKKKTTILSAAMAATILSAPAFDALKDRPTPPKSIFGETAAQRDARRAWWTHDPSEEPSQTRGRRRA